MKLKTQLIWLLCFASTTLFSQNIEVLGGLNRNSFYDFEANEGHYHSSYKSAYGYTFRFGIENLKVDWMNVRLTLGYEKYGGKIDASNSGRGGGWSTDAKINKSVISLGIFPFSFKSNQLDLNLGMELSVLVHENLSGTSNNWQMIYPNWRNQLNEDEQQISYNGQFGLRARIAYRIKISDDLSLTPQYSFYFGISRDCLEYTKSMRHHFAIGLHKTLKSKKKNKTE